MRQVLFSLLLLAGCARNKQSVELYESGDYAGAARAADEGLAAHPGDDGLWQMRVRAALALGDADAIDKAYASYQKERGDDDKDLLSDLSIATLDQALASPSAKMKIAAIQAVESAELHDLADAVAELMTNDDERVAAAAAGAVLNGFPNARKNAKILLGSEEPEARRFIIDAIGKKIGRASLYDLEKAAGGDADPRVRRAAIRWLGQLKDTEAVEILTTELTKNPDEGVRTAAAIALARIGVGDLGKLGEVATKDRSLSVRLAGIDLLVAGKRTDALVALAEDPQPLVAAEAALAAKRPELAQKALDRALVSEEWTVRAGAANLARRVLGDGALTYARKLAADKVPSVRIAAARVIAKTDKPAAIALLADELAGEASLSAATDLAELGDARGLAALSAAIRDPKRTPDERASAAFAHRSARRVTPGLVAALADSNGVVRVEAAVALVAMIK